MQKRNALIFNYITDIAFVVVAVSQFYHKRITSGIVWSVVAVIWIIYMRQENSNLKKR